MAPLAGPKFLTFAVLFLAAFIDLSSSFKSDEELLQHTDLHLAPLAVLHHQNAIKLCDALNVTKFMHQFKFLHTYIQPDTQGEEERHVAVAPLCHVYKWKKCSGEARAPLSTDCGFFELVQLPQDQCDKHTESVPTFVNHARAIQLCDTVDEISKDKPTEVKYTPIRVETEDNSLNKLSDKCVFWKYEACDELKTEGCGTWKMALHPAPECAVYSRYYNDGASQYNATTLQKLLEYSPIEYFVQETEPENTKEELVAEFGSETSSLSNLISCKKNGEQTTCSILKQSPRQKRAVSHLNTISRQKRKICCHYANHCFPCRGGGRRRGGYRGCGLQWTWS